MPVSAIALLRGLKSSGGTIVAIHGVMRHAAILLLMVVAACAGGGDLRPGADNPTTVTGSLNLSGFPPEFRKGFTDGCSAARWGTAVQPKAEGQYAVGWRDGFDYCKPRSGN